MYNACIVAVGFVPGCTFHIKMYVSYQLHTAESKILCRQPAVTYNFNIGAHLFPRAALRNRQDVDGVVIGLRSKSPWTIMMVMVHKEEKCPNNIDRTYQQWMVEPFCWEPVTIIYFFSSVPVRNRLRGMADRKSVV